MMTNEKKQKILNRNPEYLTPYLMKVFHDAPNIDNSMTIEGIAMEWSKLEESGRRNTVTIADAIKAYEKSYGKDAQIVKDITGESMPELNIAVTPSDYKVNEELTAAHMEEIKKEKDFYEGLMSSDGFPFSDDFEEDDDERFYGTVFDDSCWGVINRVNDLLDILNTSSDITVQKFTEPNPRTPDAIVAFTTQDVCSLAGTQYKAFAELTQLAKEMYIVPKENRNVRFAFSLGNVWKEHRDLTDEEMQEELDAEFEN